MRNGTETRMRSHPMGARASCVAIALAAILGLPSCDRARSADPGEGEGLETVVIRPETGAVMPVDLGPQLIRTCTREAPRGVRDYYVPAEAEIAKLEKQLPAVVAAAFSRHKNDAPDHTLRREYFRQYIGLIRSGNRRFIYVNAFPREHLERMNAVLRKSGSTTDLARDSMAWRNTPVSVCDGGMEFWGLEYDVERDAFRNFEFSDGV